MMPWKHYQRDIALRELAPLEDRYAALCELSNPSPDEEDEMAALEDKIARALIDVEMLTL